MDRAAPGGVPSRSGPAERGAVGSPDRSQHGQPGPARRVTLYASSNDEALALSKQVHGYPRAGDSGPGLVVLPGIDTIDVSAVDTSLIGHSYYGSNQTVLADLVDLLAEAKPPDLRPWLKRVP